MGASRATPSSNEARVVMRRRLAEIASRAARIEDEVLSAGPSARVVFLGAMLLGSLVLGVYQHSGLTLAYGDAVGHLYIARRTVESLTPSFAQLGGIWLPLPHVLMLPLVWQDELWRTGLAGGMVSMLAFAGATVYVYQIARALSGYRLAAVVAAALFATNANLLFMQTTAMTEPLTMLTIVAATFHLMQWTKRESLVELMLSALWVIAGTITRYEMWVFVPAGVMVVGLTAWRRSGRRAAQGFAIAWLAIASYGIVLWLIYSEVVFGDALNFARGFGTGGALASEKAAQGLLPYKGHPLLAAATYGWSVMDNLGLPLVVVGLAGCVALLASRMRGAVKLAALLPASVFLFEVLSLTLAQSAMGTPHSNPPQFENGRYGLLMLPAAVILASFLASRLRLTGVLILGIALAPQLLAFPDVLRAGDAMRRDATIDGAALAVQWKHANFPLLQGDQQITLLDAAMAGGLDRAEDAPAAWLQAHAPAGRILISATRNDAAALMMRSDLPVSRFITEGNKPYFDNALRSPSENAGLIVFEPFSPVDTLHPLFAHGTPAPFSLRFDDGQFQIYGHAVLDLGPRPAGVPTSAGVLPPGSVVGATAPPRGVPDSGLYRLFDLQCRNNLVTLVTSRRIFYADATCGRDMPPRDVVNQLLGVAVRVKVTDGTPATLTIESNARTTRMATDRAWSRSIEPSDMRPDGVPEFATPADIAQGVSNQALELSGGKFYSLMCRGDVLQVSTTMQAVYAAVNCESWPSDDVVRPLLGAPADIELVRSGDAWVITVSSPHVETLGITATRVWRSPIGSAAP